jgi:isocitrate lyase
VYCNSYELLIDSERPFRERQWAKKALDNRRTARKNPADDFESLDGFESPILADNETEFGDFSNSWLNSFTGNSRN